MPGELHPAPLALLACAAPLVLTLSACGSRETSSASTPSVTAPAASTGCPTTAPDGQGTQWTLKGTTGSVAVTGSTDDGADGQRRTPFSVGETECRR